MTESEINKVVAHWIESADRDFMSMNSMYKSQDYAWSLFVGHLVIEKLLKACYVSSQAKHAPAIHNLLKLAAGAGLNISQERKEILDIITNFNLSARYDSYKQIFYKRCTRAFTEEWINKIKSLRKWIKEEQLA